MVIVFLAYAIINVMSTRSMVPWADIAAAIHTVQAGRIWKPGGAERHLVQRIRRGHLPAGATLNEYERIIQTVIHNQDARVYIFWYRDTPYIAVVGDVNNADWLVMFAFNGVMESAYMVERPDRYLNKVEFAYVDLLSKVMSHDE
jgi:hypothetical protein